MLKITANTYQASGSFLTRRGFLGHPVTAVVHVSYVYTRYRKLGKERVNMFSSRKEEV